MSDKLEEINITVMKETANALRAFKDNMDLSMGEIVDRLLLNFSTRDINKAAILIAQIFGDCNKRPRFRAGERHSPSGHGILPVRHPEKRRLGN